MRILIVEDNHDLAKSLRRGLKATFAVDVTHTGQNGLQQAENINYDLILLDLTLPDISGEDVCRSLRFKGIKTPIIIISGRDTVQAKVDLLDLGADDYITKPFNIDEVRARIRSALRHAAVANRPNRLKYYDLVLDPAGRTVSRAGQPISLRRKEFDLLEYMVRNAGKTLTRPMMLEHIWDITENLWANVVDVHIKHLRDKVDRPFPAPLIQTVHGVGYRLEAITQPKRSKTVTRKGGT